MEVYYVRVGLGWEMARSGPAKGGPVHAVTWVGAARRMDKLGGRGV